MEVRTISHYRSDMDMLVVREGDFSFASALASAFEDAHQLVATSLDSLETLQRKYPQFIARCLRELERAHARVLHRVDVETMAEDPRLRHLCFDRIVYNFPHSGFVSGWREDRPEMIQRHRELLDTFFESARKLLKENGGEVHVVHHLHEPYSKWNVVKTARKHGLYLARPPRQFHAWVYSGYVNRRGAGAHWGRTFPGNNAATFMFSPHPPSACTECGHVDCHGVQAEPHIEEEFPTFSSPASSTQQYI